MGLAFLVNPGGFVLLDVRWSDLVERARKRLRTAGVTGLAQVCSDRGDGVSQFLDALAVHPRGAEPAP